MGEKFDFTAWATKNDLLCSDGRTIRKGAFKENDGQTVPLVWQHLSNDPMKVLGHALLENRDEGVYMYGSFNDTAQGRNAKALVEHGDVTAVSIYANQLKQQGGDVLHGNIREVSLVTAGANPGALIDIPILAHSGEEADECVIYTGLELELAHMESEKPKKKEEKPVTDEKVEEKDKKEEQDSGKTVGEVFNTLSEEQKKVVYYMIGQAIKDSESSKGKAEEKEDEEDTTVKHNIFDNTSNNTDVLCAEDMSAILKRAKTLGSLKEAVIEHFDGDTNVLIHDAGITEATGKQTYGFNDPSMLFPDYRDVTRQPEWISRNMDWVQNVMSSVHHVPFSRIRSKFANITEDDARAKGYLKGKQKKTEVFTTLKRATDPQTVYKLQKMDRDDIIDITDFDVVAWIKAEMRVMLNEEIARAILIGDGRDSDSEDKISEDHIRPIATDADLFNVKVPVSQSDYTTDGAKAIIDAVIRARKNYKGSGNPTFYTTEDVVTECLLLEDGIGHKLYKSVAELATTLRVKEIITCEVMENQTIPQGSLIGVIVNLADYNVGADKGGEISLFDDFDIDYNRYSYLIETRMSGALVKPYSAMTLYFGGAEEPDEPTP